MWYEFANVMGKDCKRFNVDGGGIANNAAVFLSSGDVPVWVNLYPNHSISIFKMAFLKINTQVIVA